MKIKKHEHKFIGVTTLQGFRWCCVCDKWVSIKKHIHNFKPTTMFNKTWLQCGCGEYKLPKNERSNL